MPLAVSTSSSEGCACGRNGRIPVWQIVIGLDGAGRPTDGGPTDGPSNRHRVPIFLRADRMTKSSMVRRSHLEMVNRCQWCDGALGFDPNTPPSTHRRKIDRRSSWRRLVRRRRHYLTFASGVSAAKVATTTIPIVFVLADDPVRLGFVTNIARPGGNLTGINFLNAELGGKRLDLLRQFIPTATRVVLLGTPTGVFADAALRDTEIAAGAAGLQIQVVKVSTSQEIDAAFVIFARDRPDALFVSPDPFFRSRRVQLTHLATRYAIPATYALRDYCDVGGLMSYGANLSDAHRQAGVYAGRILKGAKPADLPVVQASRFQLVINAQAARILGVTVPPSLLALADEVIE